MSPHKKCITALFISAIRWDHQFLQYSFYSAVFLYKSIGNFKRKAVNETVGIKTLNVGERETVKCLQNPHNSIQKCKSVGDRARKAYHKTGQY